MICVNKNCTCSQHQLLDCLEKEKNDEAKSIIQRLEYFAELVDKFGKTLLHFSTKCGNATMTQHLIEKGMNVEIQDNYGVTPLMIAVANGKLSTVEVLLNNNADIYFTNRYKVNALKKAAERIYFSAYLNLECDNILELLFDKVNKDFLTNKAETMQFLLSADKLVKLTAVAVGSVEVTKFILDNGYEINHLEEDRSALNWAMKFAKLENVATLIQSEVNISHMVRGFYLDYIFNIERVDEQAKILKIWLQYVASKWAILNEDDRNFMKQKLEDLLRRGNKETVKAMLESEFDVTTMTFSLSRTFLHLLMVNERGDVIDLLEDLNIEFDVNAQMSDGNTALMLAVYIGSVKKIEFLTRRGADVNLTSRNGRSALSRALATSHFIDFNEPERNNDVGKTCELLLQYGADVQFISSNGKSILDSMPLNYKDNVLAARVIAAHLALLEATDQSKLTERTLSSIESLPNFKTQFEYYAKQLVEMKNCKLHGTVTLFKVLITKNEETLVTYARNSKLNLAFRRTIESMSSDFASYYLNILQKMTKAINKVELERKAALAIEAFTGLCSVTHYVIIYNIIRYLSIEDLNNSCKVYSIS